MQTGDVAPWNMIQSYASNDKFYVFSFIFTHVGYQIPGIS